MGRPVSWTATLGTLSPASGITDNEGKVSLAYTAPEVTEQITVRLTFSFPGDDAYEPASAELVGTVSPPFRVVLVFRTPEGTPLSNTPIYFGFSEGERRGLLGTTDQEGRIVVENGELAGSYLFFESSTGEYKGSASLGPVGEAEVVLSKRAEGFPVAGVAVLLFLLVLLLVGVKVQNSITNPNSLSCFGSSQGRVRDWRHLQFHS